MVLPPWDEWLMALILWMAAFLSAFLLPSSERRQSVISLLRVPMLVLFLLPLLPPPSVSFPFPPSAGGPPASAEILFEFLEFVLLVVEGAATAPAQVSIVLLSGGYACH